MLLRSVRYYPPIVKKGNMERKINRGRSFHQISRSERQDRSVSIVLSINSAARTSKISNLHRFFTPYNLSYISDQHRTKQPHLYYLRQHYPFKMRITLVILPIMGIISTAASNPLVSRATQPKFSCVSPDASVCCGQCTVGVADEPTEECTSCKFFHMQGLLTSKHVHE